MLKLLKTYQKRLTNLSGNNKSLLLLKLSEKYFLDLHHLDFALNKPSFNIIENLIAHKKKISLCNSIDSRDKNSNKVAHILQQIRRTDHQIQEERGARDLYIAYPFVQGKLLDGTLIRCPLLFFSVELVLENNEWKIKLLENQAVQWNKTFLLAYSHYNTINFTEEFLDQNFEEFSTDAQVFRTELYQFIEQNPLELHFNQENFTDKLHNFKEFTKKDFDENTKIGELKLMPEAVLGIFPMADSFLVPDYDTLIANQTHLETKSLFPSLLEQDFNQNSEQNVKQQEANFITPYTLDASQEAALQAVKSGKSIVVQGPPGTGKSQLICNLVADFLAQGKKVLVVCQKRAALDVVYKRLAEKDFATSAALVHDIQADRRRIFEQLHTHIATIQDYRKTNEGFNVLYAENRFKQLCSQIDAIIAELEQFKKALYDTNLCGISVKELYLTSNPKQNNDKTERMNVINYENFSFHHYPELLSKLKTYLNYRVLDTNDFWLQRKSFATFSIADKSLLKHLLIEIPQTWQTLQDAILESLGENSNENLVNYCDFETTKLFISQENEITDFINEVTKTENYLAIWNLVQYEVTDIDTKNFQKLNKKLLKALKTSENIEKTLENDDLLIYNNHLQKYLAMQVTFFGRLKWNFAEEKKFLLELAKNNQLILTVENAKILVERIENRTKFEKLRTDFSKITWLTKQENLKYSFDYQQFSNYFDCYEKQFFSLKNTWEKFSNDFLKLPKPDTKLDTKSDYNAIKSFENFVKNGQTVIQFCKNFMASYEVWLNYFTENQLLTLIENGTKNDNKNGKINIQNITKYSKILHDNFEIFVDFDTTKNEFNTNEIELGENLYLNSKLQNATEIQDVLKSFDNHFRLFWVAKIEEQNPILRIVSSFKITQLEEELQRYLIEKNTLSTDLLHQKLREKTYQDLAFNRLNNLVSYRDLKHQVNKKRSVYPLRKLLHHFHDEIFNLMPCWLASPETVSALFEMKDLFDLVIFDEASQCFAEKGLPAIFRGKKLVIAGDSKQLAPFDLYRPRWEEEFDADEELQTALEVESLLDLGANELPSYHLRGHYRSQSLDLIDFSNQVFYNNRLHMIPHYSDFVKQEPAIEYVKVDGIWEKNCNKIEAEKVVNLIKTLQQQNKTNIGVITFNANQQSLILDLLEEKNIALSEDIFVKNIENVQGDERDIIIFSLAYAPSPSGKMSMQFGLLNLEKGENRLNVAITRAKEKIYIVASIFPHQLQTENLQNEGAKILQKYLHYALDVSEGRYKPSLAAANKQNISWYLKNQIVNQVDMMSSYETTQLPFTDITLCKSNHYKLFLTDDDLFYNAISIKEWFAYLPMQLRAKQWDFEQIWSRMWWENRDDIIPF